MSNIMDIYTGISKMQISNIKARNIDKVNLAIRKTPVRLLLPSTKARLEFFGLGNAQRATWTIRDICLFAPVATGAGVEQYAAGMVDYISLYMAAVKANRNPASNACIQDVEIELGPVKWANKDYWAIDITLTVSEVL